MSCFNSWNNSSTGFCNSNISILKSQIKPLWSCLLLVQKPPKVPHCREVGFPAGWSQTFARWIIKPHYHILCGFPPLHYCWLIHLKCTVRAAMPVTYLHFKCPRLKRVWMIRSFQHVPLLCHIPCIWGSWLETTQTEIPKAACKLLILPLIHVGFWQNFLFIKISDTFLNLFSWANT